MRTSIIAGAFGIWVCQQLGALPPATTVLGLVALALVATLIALRVASPRAKLLLAACAALAGGFAYAATMAAWRLDDALAIEREGRDVGVTGVVASMPQEFERGQRFEFEIEAADAGLPRRVWLAWYRGRHDDEAAPVTTVHAGERWRLTVRLKRPHGNLNPHGFDYEAWLFERGLRATGYVRSKGDNRRLDEFVLRPTYVVERIRESVRGRFTASLGDAPYAGVLIALAVGDQRAIPADQWQTFARTGVTHLMSISGLHVTMIAGLGYLLLGGIWRRVPRLALAVATPRVAALAGWLLALLYCLLAGFAVPAQRTLYMLAVVALARLLDRNLASSRVLCLALALVLVVDPWAVVSAGFWLSFGAVAVLFYAGTGSIGVLPWWRRWLASQWAVTLAMIPALLALFQQFSIVSPLANAIAIPLVSLLVTPLALLAVVLPVAALLSIAHGLVAGLMAGLELLASSPMAVWQQAAPAAWAVLAGTLGCLVMLLPRGVPGRWVGAVLLLPLLAGSAPRPEAGSLRVTVLDVGQGLAVHVATATHDLIYDTGPQFSLEANSGNRIILPYLRALGVRQIDTLVLSHDDSDHAGGAASLLAGLPTGRLVHGLPAGHALLRGVADAVSCAEGMSWEWDGVSFEVLHPPPDWLPRRPAHGNNTSCVLKLGAGGHALMLTGDIEAEAEARLLSGEPARLAAVILVAPHHGSRSSSTPGFAAAVHPDYVAYSVGYRNRFGHPHAEVVQRYAGARALRTDSDGALMLQLGRGGIGVSLERRERQRYWHGR